MSKILVDEMPSRPAECPFCKFIPDGHSPFGGDVKCLLTNLECNCDLLTNSKCGFLAELSNGKEEGLDLLENGDGLQIGDRLFCAKEIVKTGITVSSWRTVMGFSTRHLNTLKAQTLPKRMDTHKRDSQRTTN